MKRTPLLALAAYASLSLIPNPGLAQAGFDCAKASTPTERAICADPETAAADRAMSIAYDALMQSATDPAFKAALRQDQRDFNQWRAEAFDTARRPDLAGERLYNTTEGRAEMLNWYSPVDAPGFTGTWGNAWGQITIETRADGSTHVNAEAADQANGSWLCGFNGEVDLSGDGTAKGWTLGGDFILQRHGALLEVPVAFCDETGPPLSGSLKGLYFRIGAPE